MRPLTWLVEWHFRTKFGEKIKKLSKVDAVYSPSYGMVRGGGRLTSSSKTATKIALVEFCYLKAKHLIFPIPFSDKIARVEKRLKKVLVRRKVPKKALRFSEKYYTQTVEETNLFLELVEECGIESVCVVCERSHLSRVLLQIHTLAPELTVMAVSFEAKLEAFEAESWWKGFTNTPIIWDLWNFAGYLVTPFMIKAR